MRDVPYRHLTIHVDNPPCSLELPDNSKLDDLSSVINTGAVIDYYGEFEFEDESEVEGTTDRAWIESRIYRMYEAPTIDLYNAR